MYLVTLFLPLISFFSIVSFSRFLSKRHLMFLNILGLILSLIISITVWLEVIISKSTCFINLGSWISVGTLNVNWIFLFDSLSSTMVVLVLFISTLVHFYSWEYMSHDPHILRFLSYLSVFTFFMLFFVTAGTFLQMFFGWEGVGLSSYLLINFWYTRLQANKSAMKAIIVNRISDACLYFAVLIIFYIYGTLEYASIFGLAVLPFGASYLLQFACFGLLIGAVGKSAQLGLHTWLPDAMEGPTPVSALLHAATMVTAGVFLLIRCNVLLESTPVVLLTIFLIGALTTFFAGTIGCFQNDIKKIIAYSTCSQLGYMFLTCGFSQYSIAFFHMFNHAFFKALLFLGAGSVIHALFDEQDIRKMGGLFNFLPITFISFFVASLALAGFPSLTGFYSKDLLIEIGFFHFSVSSLFVYWLSVYSVFFTAFYSTRLTYYVFLGHPNHNVVNIRESGGVIVFVLVILTICSIFVGFIFKDLFVGVGSDTWQASIAPLPSSVVLDAEFSFVFIDYFGFVKLIPLYTTILGVISGLFLVYVWDILVSSRYFRYFYGIINQKWYFDVIYFNLVITPTMSFSYYMAFKLIDRGVLEFFGSTSLAKNLFSLSTSQNYYQTGYLYTYAAYQIVAISALLAYLLLIQT